MKTKHFKSRHALLMSLTSLMLCVSMLFGATFAWFTDSVTSGVNRIVSGNLDVELYHSNNSTAEEKVQDTTQLFKAAYVDSAEINPHQLWEPGAMTYETFRVANQGSLALTYQLNLSDIAYNYVTWGNAATQYNLTEVIKVGLIPNTATISRDTVKQYATQPLKALIGESTTATMKTASLEPGASESFTVALYWAESDNATDNHYNLNNGAKSVTNPNGWTLSDNGTQLYIDSKITLFATQYTSESDSFDNQYDANAAASSIPAFANASVISTTAAVTASEDTNLTVGNLATATVPATAAPTLKDESGNLIATDSSSLTSLTLEVKELEVTSTDPSAQDEATVAITSALENDTTNSTIQSFDVSLFATTTTETTVGTETTTTTNTTAVKSSEELITATLNIGAGKVITKVYHRSAELTTTANVTTGEYYAYNATTGILTLYVKSFSPFAVAYIIPATGITLNESAEVAVGKTVTLNATLKPAGSVGTVTWTSSDESIATVDENGVVTGVALGTATITANVNGFSATCEVKVFKDYVMTRNFLFGDTVSCSTGSDFLPIVAVMPEINRFSYKPDNTLITNEVHFCFTRVEKQEISESEYKVVVDLAIKDDKGNDLELKPGNWNQYVPSNGWEYFKAVLNLIEVQAGYSVSSVTVNGTALAKKTTSGGNPALREYWVGSNGKDVYFNSQTAGLIEVTLTKSA